VSTLSTATFRLQLKDETSGPAAQAAGALEQLRAKIDAGQKSLRQMQAAMARMRGGALVSGAEFKALRDQIDAQKASLAGMQASYVRMGGTFEAVAKEATEAKGGFAAFLDSAQRLPGPIGAIAGRVQSLVAGGPLLVVAAGLMAITAGMVALTAAAIGTAAAIARYAIAQADARRSELLRLEGLTTIRRHHGLAAGSAADMQRAIDRVADSTATGRTEVAGYAEQLYRMGLRGQALSDALEGVSITASVQGDAMARRFAGIAVGAARAGRSVRGLTDDVRRRLGGIAARQMLSLDVQSRRLREGIARIFSGLRIDGFLRLLNEVTDLFSQSRVEGRALRIMVESLFGPLLGGADDAAPVLRRFFQGMIIGALRLTISILRIRRAFREAFASVEVIGRLESTRIALYAGAAAFALLAAAVLATTVAIVGFVAVVTLLAAAVAATIAVFAAPFLLALAAASAAIAGFITGAVLLWRGAVGWWESAGESMVDGIVRGMQRGSRRLVQGVQIVARDAQAALRDALGIHSPSRVFAELGVQIPRGLAQGIEGGAPIAAQAVDDMAPLGGAARAGGGSTTSVSIGQLVVQTQASDTPGIVQSIRDELARVLEGTAIAVGGRS
jgi:hypothetical protein